MTNQELTDSLRQLNSAVEKLSMITQEQCNYRNMRVDYASLIKGIEIVVG